MPVSYFGGRVGASKLKWVGVGIIVMGLGFFVFALPHFLVGSYRADNLNENNVCTHLNLRGNTTENCDNHHESGVEDLSWNVWFFFFAQILHGMGMSASKSSLFKFQILISDKIRSIAPLHAWCYLY